MTDLQTLIARLEAADEGCPELDAAITAALRIRTDALPDWAFDNFPVWRARTDGRVEVVHGDGTGGLHWKAKTYTTSLDAAVTLMFKEWLWDVASTGCVWVMPSDNLDRQIIVSGIENPILALCIAALKAREAS